MTIKPGLSLSIGAHYNLGGTLSSGRKCLFVLQLYFNFESKVSLRNKPVVKIHYMKSNEVLEFLVLGQLDNIREVYLGLERGVRLFVQTVPGALPLKPFVNLRHSWLK